MLDLSGIFEDRKTVVHDEQDGTKAAGFRPADYYDALTVEQRHSRRHRVIRFDAGSSSRRVVRGWVSLLSSKATG